MFAKGLKVKTDLKLGNKSIGHINLQKLQNMQSKGVFIGLPNFMERKSIGICDACQFSKQRRHPFPTERNVSKGVLCVIHSDVWGSAQIETFRGGRYYVRFTDNFPRHT